MGGKKSRGGGGVLEKDKYPINIIFYLYIYMSVKSFIHKGKYTIEIFYSAIFICIIGLYLGYYMNQYNPPFDPNKQKIQIWIEIILQVSLLACATYFVREFLNWGLPDLVPEKPIKYAIIIMAPIMFTQQNELILKMKHITK